MNKESSIEAVKHVLADVYVLALMTQNAHWNMVGPSFIGLHKLFEGQYNDLIGMTDELAERIRALGESSPSSMQEFLDLTRLEEPEALNEELTALSTLNATYKKLSGFLVEHITELDALQDPGTSDLLTDILRFVDKQAWLLNSHL